MPTKNIIDMDIDEARNFSSNIHSFCDIFDERKRTLLRDCLDLNETWNSDSYFRFLDLINTEGEVFTQKVNALRTLVGALDAAIAAYWEADMGLSGS